MRALRLHRLATGIAAFGAFVLAVMASSGQSRADDPTTWFARPSVLPTDVFDLSAFDAYRSGGRLNVAQAAGYLEALSERDLPAAQRLFDIMAWRAFVALNWAAQPDGTPDPGKGFTDADTPRIWEYWRRPADVYLPNGAAPAPWGGPAGKGLDRFKAAWKMNTTVNEGKQAFSGPLIDQNGRWVHYVSFMNRPEFDYIVAHELYNLEGQAAFVQSNQIQFPVNTDTAAGAIEIKFAWKELTPAEEQSHRFFVRRLPVVVYQPAAAVAAAGGTPPAHLSGRINDNGPSPEPQVRTLGMIGMHIAMRTRSSPQWIWATFEQIDNTRLDDSSGDPTHPLPAKPSLSDPDNPVALVSANLLPAYNAVGADGAPINDWDETRPIPPVEVLRPVPPPQGTARINAAVQAFLGSQKSVLRYYELNGTQWPKHPKAPAVPGGQGSAPDSIVRKTPGEVVPVYLVNATMETYFQKGYQQAAALEQDDRVPVSIDTTMVFGTESCVGCHYSAGACIGFRKDSRGKELRDATGRKIPIFGLNSVDGLTGGANFSWLLQLEARSKEQTR